MTGKPDRTRWWSRGRGLPRAAYASWRASLADRPGWPSRILAWAQTADGFCIGSPAALSVGNTEHWTHAGWHEIENGTWNAETRQLSWRRLGGGPGSVALVQPGRLPELFRERVAASIAIQRFVPISGDRGLTVTARRDLGGGGPLTWHTSLTRGLTWNTPGVRETAERVTTELQEEYDAG